MLNVDKTEWLLVGSRRTLSSLDITRPVLQLGGNIVAASDHVHLLGIDIVSDLSLDRHVNSVLAAAPKTTTDKLQRVLNAAARVVSNTRKFDCGLSQLLHDRLTLAGRS